MADEITEPEVESFELPEDFASRVQSWGVDLNELDTIVQRGKGPQTEDELIDDFIQKGQMLGFGVRELQSLIEPDQHAPAAPPVPETPDPLADDPDRFLTAREARELLEAQKAEFQSFRQEQEQQTFQQRQARVFEAIDDWFTTNGITDEDERNDIATRAGRHIQGDSYDPRVSIAALEQGKKDYQEYLNKAASKYLEDKKKDLDSSPTVSRGASQGGEPEERLDYAKVQEGKAGTSAAVEAAKAKVRARLKEAGYLD